jgi:hypothetical protein
VRVARRQLQIDDLAVARQRRVEAEVDFADQLFVRSRGTERSPVQDHFPPLDAQPYHARVGRRRGEPQHHGYEKEVAH